MFRLDSLFLFLSISHYDSYNRCAHCKAFEVIFKMLADSLADDPSVQIVRIDATKNDVIHPNVRVNAFPTFYFFSVGDQEEPIEYDGERTMEAILKFIKAFKSSAATKAATAAAAGATTGTQTLPKPSLTLGDRSSSTSESESEDENNSGRVEGETAVTGSDTAE